MSPRPEHKVRLTTQIETTETTTRRPRFNFMMSGMMSNVRWHTQNDAIGLTSRNETSEMRLRQEENK